MALDSVNSVPSTDIPSKKVLRSALRAWCSGVAKRSSVLCAIVAVARKLAGLLHRMWIDSSDFKVGFGAKVTQRLKLKPAR